VNLRELFAAARETDEVSSLDQDGTNLLQTAALMAGRPPKKAALVKNITKELIDQHWTGAVEAVTRAGRLLASVGSPDTATVPYDAMVPALAAAVTAIPEQSSPAARESLRRKVNRWLQQTAFLQRYNEGTDVKQAADYPEAAAWFRGGSAPAFLADAVVWQESWNRLSRSGARYRAFVAMLNDIGPRDLIEVGKHLGRGIPDRHTAQLHHIFPRAFLREAGVPNKDIEVALNITFLTAESNNFISDRAPSLYLDDRIGELVADGASRDGAITSLKSLLAEHLIDDAGWDALMRDDYDSFLAARANAVRKRLGDLGINVVLAPDEDADSGDDEIGDEAGAIDDTFEP
jgi:hypothetical protein